MRLILSRKGFDSSAGGCPNPVFPDGSALSLPIPDSQSPIRYEHVKHKGESIGKLVEDLTAGKVSRHDGAHLDPDLVHAAYERSPDWKPILGQHGQAQSHLMKQGVGEGDLFLFFAVFRSVEYLKGGWRFVPGTRPFHGLWGWLQVAEVVPLDGRREPPGWTTYHSHHYGTRGVHNTLYLSGEDASLRSTGSSLAGAGVFRQMLPEHRLTHPAATRLTEWLLPAAFYPSGERPPLSYHHNRERWHRCGDYTCSLRSAARGQEFVLDLDLYPELVPWVVGLLQA
ncbi:hypothetical protein ACFOZ5_05270 [Marinobacter lacisalsi]|uniref:Nucleotide modification associated domain-containing protein n=1 Tax=Marinobacter lacisalsi TaxID=475979 RepID=A0ABV8QFZ7_9GAMM